MTASWPTSGSRTSAVKILFAAAVVLGLAGAGLLVASGFATRGVDHLRNIGAEFVGAAITVLVVSWWVEGAIGRAEAAREREVRIPAISAALRRLERLVHDQEVGGVMHFFSPPTWQEKLDAALGKGWLGNIDRSVVRTATADEDQRRHIVAELIMIRVEMHRLAQESADELLEWIQDETRCSSTTIAEWLQLFSAHAEDWERQVDSAIAVLQLSDDHAYLVDPLMHWSDSLSSIRVFAASDSQRVDLRRVVAATVGDLLGLWAFLYGRIGEEGAALSRVTQRETRVT